jgi:hypothetical protein
MELPFYTPRREKISNSVVLGYAEKCAGQSVSGHGPQPFPVD